MFDFFIRQSYTLTCTCLNVNEDVAYQWRKNDTILSEFTESTLSLSRLRLSDADRYTCNITVTNEVYNGSKDIIIQSESDYKKVNLYSYACRDLIPPITKFKAL